MYLSSLSDLTGTSIKTRIRSIFFVLAMSSLSYFFLDVFGTRIDTDFSWFYTVGFLVSFLSCSVFFIRPKIGTGSLYLAPLFIVSFVRVINTWYLYFNEEITLSEATRSSFIWTMILTLIIFIDLLESRIYHRMVGYLEQESK